MEIDQPIPHLVDEYIKSFYPVEAVKSLTKIFWMDIGKT
jgi:hypothetical protein